MKAMQVCFSLVKPSVETLLFEFGVCCLCMVVNARIFVSSCSHTRLRCLCGCNRCPYCLCQSFLKLELLRSIQAQLHRVIYNRFICRVVFQHRLLPLSLCFPPLGWTSRVGDVEPPFLPKLFNTSGGHISSPFFSGRVYTAYPWQEKVNVKWD